MCDWNKQLNSSKENTRTDEAKLPAHWLADNGEHATSLDALWALRDFLVQDSLGVVKVLNHASLQNYLGTFYVNNPIRILAVLKYQNYLMLYLQITIKNYFISYDSIFSMHKGSIENLAPIG